MIINFNKISTIVFDLGGVLLNIKPELSHNAFKALGLHDDSLIEKEYEKGGIFNLLEKGKISEKEFRKTISTYLAPETTNLDIDNAWNSMLLDFTKERIDLLNRLSKKFNIYLLSNTNSIHCGCFNQELKKTRGILVDDLFIKAFYSHEMCERKPESERYKKRFNELEIDASEILFVDDLEVNVKVAKEIGINAIHLDLEKGESVLDIFEDF